MYCICVYTLPYLESPLTTLPFSYHFTVLSNTDLPCTVCGTPVTSISHTLLSFPKITNLRDTAFHSAKSHLLDRATYNTTRNYVYVRSPPDDYTPCISHGCMPEMLVSTHKTSSPGHTQQKPRSVCRICTFALLDTREQSSRNQPSSNPTPISIS